MGPVWAVLAYLATVCDLWHDLKHCSLDVAQVRYPLGRHVGPALSGPGERNR